MIAAVNAVSRLSSRAAVRALDCLASLSFAEEVALRPIKQAGFGYALHQAAVAALASGVKKLFVAFSLLCAMSEVIHHAFWQIRLRTDRIEWRY